MASFTQLNKQTHETNKPIGVYGYLGGYLLRMASKSDVYVYLAEDKNFAEEYGFKTIRSPFWKISLMN